MACQEKDAPELEQQLAQAKARIAELETALQRQASEPAEPALYQELEAAHRRTSEILDSITECYFAMDRQFHLTALNERAKEYLGQPREPLLGRVPWEIYPHLADSPITHLLRKAMAEQVPVHEEAASWLTPGRWLELHVYPSAQGLELHARDITNRKQMERRLQELNEGLEHRVLERTAQADQRGIQLQRLAIELTQAEQRERQRLAQVLHDHLQQLLVAARIKTKILQIGLRNDPLQDSARQVQELLEESIAVSRSLTLELSPPILQEADFEQVLPWLATWMQDKHGLHVQIQVAESVRVPSGDLRYLLFRAVRELLFNVVKHAGTDQAVVKVTQADDQVQVIVADEGRGFDPAAEPAERSVGGFGLASLRERLEMLGGQIRIDSGPGRGTQVTLRVPAGLPSQGSNSPTGPGRTE